MRRLRFAIVIGGVAVSSLGAAPAPSMPRPPPFARAHLADNATCEGCHVDIASEWRQSLHRAAFTDPTFQRSLDREPDPFCKGCHAPEADVALGVACVTCHVTSADVLAAPRGNSERSTPHPVTRTAAFASEAACAACHEFDFPDARSRRKPLAMQRTISEHAGRPDTCATCHMPTRSGHLDHRFAASRDEGLVRSAVSVRATRPSGTRIVVTLAPALVGHAFPTGDLFRRVRITAGGTTRYLARHYASRQELPGVFVRSEIGDDRVLTGEDRVVELTVPEGPVRVRVVYERAEGPLPGSSVAGAIELLDREL